MQLVHADEVAFRPPGTKHREPNIEFKHLLKGRRGSPQNFELLIARSKGRFYSPRHRHNFDQIRLGLSGKHGDGKGADVGPGGVGYYPEGVHYMLDCADSSEILLLQLGGASGHGFTHYEQLYAAYPEVAKLGDFKDGVFSRHDKSNLAPGIKRNQDGYEALWEHIHGKPVVYPRPRYTEPVLMQPDNTPWRDDRAQPGVARRTLGIFTERLIEIGQIRVAEGAVLEETARQAPRILFVQSGAGEAEDGLWHPHSTALLETGEACRIRATEPMQIFVMGLPVFEQDELPG